MDVGATNEKQVLKKKEIRAHPYLKKKKVVASKKPEIPYQDVVPTLGLGGAEKTRGAGAF